jgi:hypothetical protein
MSGYTYLASPYSHPDPAQRVARFDRACREAAKLMEAGEAIFCPIAHSHPIEVASGHVGDFEFWMHQDLPILARSQKVKVLKLEGWDISRGITREIEHAHELGIPVEYLEDDEANK